MSTSSVRHFGTEIDMDLRFFALVHKYSLVLDSIRIEKVIFFLFFGGGYPLNERCNPGLSFKTTEDLTNVLPGKILQLKSQKGRCQKVCDFEKSSITVFQI